ncbi:hypothetical protein A4A49_16813 [Nicotiana attenuata]|uniref:Uncharacterized protein n=1 Tax=Nicotiana attenuata TaxID=49451 RepID=A0A314KP99_NICAT|nr:hypothetical protein A4A49_16813 [Nicotiana attenuata]
MDPYFQPQRRFTNCPRMGGGAGITLALLLYGAVDSPTLSNRKGSSFGFGFFSKNQRGNTTTSHNKETKTSVKTQEKKHHQSCTIKEKEGWKTQRKRQSKGQNNKKQHQTFIPKQTIGSQKGSEKQQVETQKDTQAQSSRETQQQGKETTTPQKQHPAEAPTITQERSFHLTMVSVAELEEQRRNSQEDHSLDERGDSKGGGVPQDPNQQKLDQSIIGTSNHPPDIIGEYTNLDTCNSEDDQSAIIKQLAKGKAKNVSDFSIQVPTPKNNSSQKKRRAMRRKNAKILPTEQNQMQDDDVERQKTTGEETLNNDCDTKCPKEDEYKPIQSEVEPMEPRDWSEEEIDHNVQLCELLIEAVNGSPDKQELIMSQNLSPRMGPSPRVTRSKVVVAINILPKFTTPSKFQ